MGQLLGTYMKQWKGQKKQFRNVVATIKRNIYGCGTYMYSGTFTENREMKEGISFILENLVAPEEKIEFMGQMQLYRMKLSSLFT